MTRRGLFIPLLVLAACGPRHAPEGQPPLAIIAGDLSAFQKSFNDAADTLRVIVLMSPT